MALEGDRHLIVILGTTGDLARRELLSSLYRIITPGASASQPASRTSGLIGSFAV